MSPPELAIDSGEAAPSVTVIVPCFNERDGIAGTIDQLLDVLTTMDGPTELVVVDDGSTDGTAEVLDGLEAQHAPVLRVARHERNTGYGAAIKTGVRRSSGELIVITDADGTYPNDRIPGLVDEARQADMVVGARTGENVTYSSLRKFAKFFLMRYASWIAGRSIPDINSGLRVMRRSVLERFLNILPNGFSLTTTITLAMLNNHYDVRFVPIDYAARIGKSKIQPVRDTLRFFTLILRTGMYFAPLRVFLPLGLFVGLLFLVSLGYDIFALNNLTDKSVLLFSLTANIAMFALLADMIDKRTGG